jgi:TonB family protein
VVLAVVTVEGDTTVLMALLAPVMALLLAPQPLPVEPPGKTVKALLREFRSDDSSTREAAVSALADVRPVQRDVLEALANVLSDDKEDVRTAARTALDSLSAVEGFSLIATGLDRPPSPLRLPRPEYPPAAFAKKTEGTVIVECLIGRDGGVISARVVQSVSGLDEAALATARTWVFTPALKNGRMVPTIAHAPVKFRIN